MRAVFLWDQRKMGAAKIFFTAGDAF